MVDSSDMIESSDDKDRSGYQNINSIQYEFPFKKNLGETTRWPHRDSIYRFSMLLKFYQLWMFIRTSESFYTACIKDIRKNIGIWLVTHFQTLVLSFHFKVLFKILESRILTNLLLNFRHLEWKTTQVLYWKKFENHCS